MRNAARWNRRRGPAGVLAAVAVLTSAACASDAPPTSTSAVRDSAGITVVSSSGPLLEGSAAWSIGSEPVLAMGAVEGAGPQVFGRVWDATRFDDGRIVVVDELALEIRVFDASGAHLLTFGGEGDGPEEFGGPPFVKAVGNDTIVTWDGGHARLSRFSSDGRLLDQVPMREALGSLGVLPFRNGLVWEIDRTGHCSRPGLSGRPAARVCAPPKNASRSLPTVASRSRTSARSPTPSRSPYGSTG